MGRQRLISRVALSAPSGRPGRYLQGQVPASCMPRVTPSALSPSLDSPNLLLGACLVFTSPGDRQVTQQEQQRGGGGTHPLALEWGDGRQGVAHQVLGKTMWLWVQEATSPLSGPCLDFPSCGVGTGSPHRTLGRLRDHGWGSLSSA